MRRRSSEVSDTHLGNFGSLHLDKFPIGLPEYMFKMFGFLDSRTWRGDGFFRNNYRIYGVVKQYRRIYGDRNAKFAMLISNKPFLP